MSRMFNEDYIWDLINYMEAEAKKNKACIVGKVGGSVIIGIVNDYVPEDEITIAIKKVGVNDCEDIVRIKYGQGYLAEIWINPIYPELSIVEEWLDEKQNKTLGDRDD